MKVDGLVKHFPVLRGVFQRQVGAVHAVDGISFEINRGETFGLVGESGCGKSTAGRTILQLYRPTAGKVIFDNVSLTGLSREELRKMRRRMQMIFQDPYASLNPRMTVADIISEPLMVHGVTRGDETSKRVDELLQVVRLSPSFKERYPHEFSGGQRQRIGLARTLALSPRLIVADEPVSALDVSVQAQVLNLLQELKEQMGLTLLFVAHDLSVVEHVSDRVAVMYVGKIVEMAPTEELLRQPLHPYTEALLSSIPPADPDIHADRIQLQGEVPSPAKPPSGCIFHPRCSYAKSICSEQVPALVEASAGHFVSCHFAKELVLRGIA